MTKRNSRSRGPRTTRPEPTYEVGYGRPPKEHQFKKGRSGNPNGRPPGSPNLRSQAVAVLTNPIGITVDGQRQRVPALLAVERVVLKRGLNDDQRAAEFLFRLAKELGAFVEQGPDDLSSQGFASEYLDRLSGETLKDLLRVAEELRAEKQRPKTVH